MADSDGNVYNLLTTADSNKVVCAIQDMPSVLLRGSKCIKFQTV